MLGSIAIACGLVTISARRTFDTLLKIIFIDIKQRISTMRSLFIADCLTDPPITATQYFAKSKR